MDKETADVINNVIKQCKAIDASVELPDNKDGYLYFRMPLNCMKALQEVLVKNGFEYEEPLGI